MLNQKSASFSESLAACLRLLQTNRPSIATFTDDADTMTVPSLRMPIPQSRSAEAVYSLKRLDQNAKAIATSPMPPASPTPPGGAHSSPKRVPAPESSTPRLLAKQRMRVSLNVRADTLWGDKVLLVGNTPQLGDWEPARSSLVLTTDARSYPMWRCNVDIELPISGQALEYKLVVVRGSSHPHLGSRVVEWEPLAANRRLAPHVHHTSKAAHVTIAWGEAGASMEWRWEW